MFAEGIVATTSGKHTPFNRCKCVPPAWRLPSNHEKLAEEQMQKVAGMFNSVVTKLGAGSIEMACKVKKTIISWLNSKTKRRNLRRRFFMALRTNKGRKRLEKGFFGSIGNAFSSAANSVSNVVSSAANSVASAGASIGNSIVSGAKAVGGAIVNGAEAVGSGIVNGVKAVGNGIVAGAKAIGGALLSGAAAIFNAIVEPLKGIHVSFTEFFRSPLFKQTQGFLGCLIRSLKDPKIKRIISHFLKNIKEILSGWTGFVSHIIHALCEFAEFKKASELINNAVKNPKAHHKWALYGKFIGKIVHALGKK